MDIQDVIREQVTNNNVVLYMKGTPDFPQCGFSASAVVWASWRKFTYVGALSSTADRLPEAK